MSEINLLNLGGGVAVEKFNRELEKLLENILDPNTDPIAKRAVTMTVSIKPAKDRNFGALTVETSARLAPDIAFASRAFFGRKKDGKVAAFEDNPNQLSIADFIAEPGTEKVVDILKTETEKEAIK